MKKKIFPIVAALIILLVLFIVLNHDNPEFRDKVGRLIKHLNSWLDIDWESIKRWMSA